MSHSDLNYVLEIENISKAFPGVKALQNVNFNVIAGEVHALVGENGAGKSTLMNILSGIHKKDEGQIFIDGEKKEPASPLEAKQFGISIIHQELNLINRLTVAENIYIGRPPKKNGVIQWSAMFGAAQQLLDTYGIKLKAKQIVNELSVAQQQMVEIAKAISYQSKVVIMDEPSSSLTKQEISVLFTIIDSIKEKGVSVIYISHKLDEVFHIADRITVLRDGQSEGTYLAPEITRDELISKMIGRALTKQFPPRDVPIGDVIFEAVGLSDSHKVHDISFQLHSGEVLGFAGIVGSGRTETMRLIFGADPKSSGFIRINGKQLNKSTPRVSIKNHIGFVTEDRKQEGLLLTFSVKFNTTIVSMKKIVKNFLLNMQLEIDATRRYIEELGISTPSVDQKVKLLSGGNQQKVVLAKWLFSDTDVIIMDEPTRGIDVGAKKEIYEIINRLAATGKGIIVVSSEMEEVMGVCDRIIVMSEGRIVGNLEKSEFSQVNIAKMAVGG